MIQLKGETYQEKQTCQGLWRGRSVQCRVLVQPAQAVQRDRKVCQGMRVQPQKGHLQLSVRLFDEKTQRPSQEGKTQEYRGDRIKALLGEVFHSTLQADGTRHRSCDRDIHGSQRFHKGDQSRQRANHVERLSRRHPCQWNERVSCVRNTSQTNGFQK